MRDVMWYCAEYSLEVPLSLLEKAQQASGQCHPDNPYRLHLVAASRTYGSLAQTRGKCAYRAPAAELKADR